MSDRILISCIHLQRRFEDFRSDFEQRGLQAELPEVDQQLSEGWLEENLGRFVGAIAGDDPFPRHILEAAKPAGFRALVKWGVGVDAIDRVACHDLGIAFTNTPGAFGNEVADVAMGYVISLARGLHLIDQSVRDGGWAKPVGKTLAGHRIGVVGLGSIGRSIAHRAEGFGMDVVGYDVAVPDGDVGRSLGRSLPEVLEQSDFVVLACNLTEDNRHMINEESIARMKRGAYLVNVARGPLVDEAALVAGLQSGHLAGAALDVFEVEPLPQNSPLRDLENCVFGSHNGSNTGEAVDRVNRLAVDRLFELLRV